MTAPVSCPRVGCDCSACTVEAALTLLRSGRTAMDLTLLEALPARLREARTAAVAEVGQLTAELRSLGAEVRELGGEVERARRELAVARGRAETGATSSRPRAAMPPSKSMPPKLARKPRPHELLDAALVSGRVTPARVAELLRVAPTDVAAIAAGRVELPATTWARLLDGIADDIRHAEGLP